VPVSAKDSRYRAVIMWKWIIAPCVLIVCAYVGLHEVLIFDICSWMVESVSSLTDKEQIRQAAKEGVPYLRGFSLAIGCLMLWWAMKGRKPIKEKAKNEDGHEDHALAVLAAPVRRTERNGDLPIVAVRMSGGSIGSIGSIGGHHSHNHFFGRHAMESGTLRRVGRAIADNDAYEELISGLIECLHADNA
jgi:hypothetical protein